MIYVYLTLFLISLSILTYTLYSMEINRKLNIKKRQIAIRPNRNRFYVIFCVNVLMTFTFGGLFVYKLFYRPTIPVQEIVEEDYGGKSVARTTPVTTLPNNLEYVFEDNGYKERNVYYYRNDETLYRYDLKKEELSTLEIGKSDYALIKNNIVTYYDKEENGKYTTYIDLYDKDSFKIIKTIEVDGKLKTSFEYVSFLFGGYVNVLTETFDVSELDKVGYKEIDYTYETIDEEEVVEKVEKDKVAIKEILIPQYHNYDRVVINLQYNVSTDEVGEKSICLSDYYMAHVDGYLYFFCNCYSKDHYENNSFILKYNPNDLGIRDYHTYNNIIYSSPSIYKDGMTSYLSFLTYNAQYQNYQRVTINDSLQVIDEKEVFVDRSEFRRNNRNYIVLNDKLTSVNNILYYNNELLINYEVDKENNKIVLSEYKLYQKEIDKYNLFIDEDIEDAKIIEVTKMYGNYYVIYEVNGKKGYIYFEPITEDEGEESEEESPNKVKVLEKDLQIELLSDDEYHFVDSILITIHKNDEDELEFSTKILDSLKEEEEESGE